jgi:hypothetical protein
MVGTSSLEQMTADHPQPNRASGNTRLKAGLQIGAAAVCLAAGTLSIWRGRSLESAPAQVFLNPPRSELGKLQQKQTAQAETIVVNNTGTTIKIESIDATCGCTKPHTETDILAPGSSTKLSAEIHTGFKRGELSSVVTLNYAGTDTPIKGSLAWTIRAEIETEYSASPESLFLTRNKIGLHHKIHLASRTVRDFAVSGVSCSHKCLQASCARGPTEGEWTVDVQLLPQSTTFPAGRHWLTVSTNAAVQPELMIPIYVAAVTESGETTKADKQQPAGGAR